ncbi:MAG: hypothetical protein NT018_01335 [Armatimonadetes bacterium]|nr:hypothetical protein [Armatimonadota bacterium]
MKVKLAILGFVFLAASIGAAHSATLKVRDINAVADTILVTESKLKLSGAVRIQNENKVAKTSFDATAKNMVANFFQKADGKAKAMGMTSIKSATMDGPVKIIYTELDDKGKSVKTTATADNATYDGVGQIATLVGHVNIVRESAEDSLVLTGDTGYVNLKPNLGEDETRFKVESATGVSTIDVTPKAQPKKENK